MISKISSRIKFQVAQILLLMIPIFLDTGCKKFVTVDTPSTDLVSSSVFADDATAMGALASIYSKMSNGTYTVSWYLGLSSDEMTDYSGIQDLQQLNSNSLLPTNSYVQYLWFSAYEYIYMSNAILEGLQKYNGVSAPAKKQITAEAKFIRAFWNFYLVNLYGDIPIINATNYLPNSTATRKPANEVYDQIIKDLREARDSLGEEYLDGTNSPGFEKTRPNKFAAEAMLSRVYLYVQDWQHAEIESSNVINSNGFYQLESDLNNVFLANSNEAIWQLQPTMDGYNSMEGYQFILTSPPQYSVGQVALNYQFANSFEAGDLRKMNWMDSIVDGTDVYYYPFKYKVQGGVPGTPVTEYTTVLRLAEQYLIRAEARAELDDLAGAKSDINVIRNRAGLADDNSTDKASLLLAIEQERKSELFTEWGQRWLDLKRTSRADIILAPVKPQWKSSSGLYPIPFFDIQNNPNLTQNPGY